MNVLIAGPRRAPLMASLLATAALAAGAAGDLSTDASATDEIALEVSIKDHKFEPANIRVPANTPVKLSVKNLDPSPEEFESHELRVEKVIAGNSATTIRIKPLAAGTYKFFGEYHEATALGHIVAE
jgi:plastocyanin